MSRPRRSETGLTIEEELRAWDCVFRFGRDYFHDLPRGGIIEGKFSPSSPDHIARARSAWSRLRDSFLSTWRPDSGHPRPWAEEEFGR